MIASVANTASRVFPFLACDINARLSLKHLSNAPTFKMRLFASLALTRHASASNLGNGWAAYTSY
jgi:hypothetical protein